MDKMHDYKNNGENILLFHIKNEFDYEAVNNKLQQIIFYKQE